ncbi:hypothetical protein GCM10009848_28000 [Micromonospora lupini]
MRAGLHPLLIALLVSHGTPVTPGPASARDVHPASWDDAPGTPARSGTLAPVTRTYPWFRQPAQAGDFTMI